MKRLLLRGALAALVLSGLAVSLMLVRAALLRPVLPPGGERLPFAFDELGAPERLAGALRLLDPSSEGRGGGEVDLPAYLAEAFPRVHASLEREVLAGGSLLYRWPGADPGLAPILVAAHMDRADSRSSEGPNHAAESGAVDGGFIWGRGAGGAAGSSLAALEAVEGLVAARFAPRRTVLLAFAFGEPDAGGMAARLEEAAVRPAWILTGGLYLTAGVIPGVRDPVGMVAVAEKTAVDIRLTVQAEPGSPSVPPRRTASGILGEALARLDQAFTPEIREPNLELLTTLGPHADPGTRLLVANLWLLGQPLARALTERPLLNASLRTTAVTESLRFGASEGRLASEAEAGIRLQLAPWDDPDGVIERLRTRLSDLPVELEFDRSGVQAGDTGGLRPWSSAGFGAIRAAIHRSFPDVVAVVPAVNPHDAGAGQYTALTDSVYGFSPFRVDQESLQEVPGSLGRVRIGVYTAAVRFYAELLRRGSK